MSPPAISCIVPAFNGEAYLGEALHSILRQRYQPVQIIVVDDGSTDGTAAVAASFGERVAYRWQPHSGPAAARNFGLEAARGQYVAFLDADDLWHPDKLTRQMARFAARPELDACLAHVQNFWVPELSGEAERCREHRRAQPVPGYVLGTLLARRQLFETVGRFNAALQHGDATDWFLRAREQDAVMELLPDVLLYRRLHHTNHSRRLAPESRNEYLDLIKAALDRRRRGPEAG